MVSHNTDAADPNKNSEDIETISPKKQRRKKLGFSVAHKKPSKNRSLISLPSNLSDFSWIENSDQNKALLDEEKQKLIELKKNKDT